MLEDNTSGAKEKNMGKILRIEQQLSAIAEQPRFIELAKFMDSVIAENESAFISDNSKMKLAGILARMYSQGGEVSLHDEYNAKNNEIIGLMLETVGCVRTYNKIRGAHHFAQIPAIFTPLRYPDEPCEKQETKDKKRQNNIVWSSEKLLTEAISDQGHFLNLCDLFAHIDHEFEHKLSEYTLSRIIETLARAYRQGGELSLRWEVQARNLDTMVLLRSSSECIITEDDERKDVFYQFSGIWSPHQIMGPERPR